MKKAAAVGQGDVWSSAKPPATPANARPQVGGYLPPLCEMLTSCWIYQNEEAAFARIDAFLFRTSVTVARMKRWRSAWSNVPLREQALCSPRGHHPAPGCPEAVEKLWVL